MILFCAGVAGAAAVARRSPPGGPPHPRPVDLSRLVSREAIAFIRSAVGRGRPGVTPR